MMLVIGPRLERHSVNCLAIRSGTGPIRRFIIITLWYKTSTELKADRTRPNSVLHLPPGFRVGEVKFMVVFAGQRFDD